MKKYSFRLQTVLDVRAKTLEDRRLEMAKVIKLLSEQQDELDALEAKKVSSKKELETMYSEGLENFDFMVLTNYKNYLAKLENDIINQKAKMENTRKVLQARQLAVAAAHKKLRVLEMLKEKQETKFYKEIDEAFAKEIDDIATIRYNANNK